MLDLVDTCHSFDDDDYEEPSMNPKYMLTLETEDMYETSIESKTSKDSSAPNPLFSNGIKAQVPILFDLGTTKSLIKPIQAYWSTYGCTK